MSDNQQRRAALRGRPLSDRELQILRLSANGLTGAEIGRELWITPATVKSHQRRIYSKLGATDATHAVALAFAAELLTGADLVRAA